MKGSVLILESMSLLFRICGIAFRRFSVSNVIIMIQRLTRLLIVILALALSSTLPAQDRMNVRDYGASGSSFETKAQTTAGSNQITVSDVGDFKVGQGVAVSRCNIRYQPIQMWGTGRPYYNTKKVDGSVEIRGYDGAGGSWLVHLIDIAPGKAEFRWSDDLGRNWHTGVPITHGWQALSGGIEVKLGQRDWESGYVIALGARDQLVTTIEKIEGKVLTLKDVANRSAEDAVVRHNDDQALQAVIDTAIREKRNVFLPVGRYRLSRGLMIQNASALVIEGQSAADTILDISDGEGSCFSMRDGEEVTLRNLRMIGFMGFDEADRAGSIAMKGASAIWGMSFRHCNATSIRGTERVLVENCHASRMSAECFVAGGGPGRTTVKPDAHRSQSITYLRCSATDCARNAFNDVNSTIENTNILQCRIENVGGCAWEGASRYVRFIGNYVSNAGPVGIGNLGPGNRDETFPDLGSAQHIVAENIFEKGTSYGGQRGSTAGIQISRGATQVIVRNNTFVNFNSGAVAVVGGVVSYEYPASNITITGNSIDLSCIGEESISRIGILLSEADLTVSDNQIYVRSQTDSKATGIRIQEPVSNLVIHDNLIRNCEQGILSLRGQSRVGEVLDPITFIRSDSPPRYLPLDRFRTAQYEGWQLVWENGKSPQERSTIASFDPETLRFTLREPREMKAEDLFTIVVPHLNWNIHNNIITGCREPVVLASPGSQTALFHNNLIERGGAVNVKQPIVSTGSFQIEENRVVGFDQPDSPTRPAPSAQANAPDKAKP